MDESIASRCSTQEPKLLDRLRERLQARGHGLDTQTRYIEWCRQFIVFHGKRHPRDMGPGEVERFLADLERRRLALSWRREARAALSFLYREELGRALALPEVGRPARTRTGVGVQPQGPTD